MAKTVVPEKKDARVARRDMTARSREVRNTVGAMSIDEKSDEKGEANHEVYFCSGVDLSFYWL